MTRRPGWGERHPDVAALLARSTPAAVRDETWGDSPIRIAAYDSDVDLPDEFVTSIRCMTFVDDRIVVCTNADGHSHPWPGGRREPGETYAETARREVHEETGWWVSADSIERIGWMHIEVVTALPDDHPYPHPDVLQVVTAGRASERACAADAAWCDTEGYELSSRLLTPAEALEAVGNDPVCAFFVRKVFGLH